MEKEEVDGRQIRRCPTHVLMCQMLQVTEV